MKRKNRLKNKHIKKNMISIEQPEFSSVLKSQNHSSVIREGYEGYESLDKKFDDFARKGSDLEGKFNILNEQWKKTYESAQNELNNQGTSDMNKFKNTIVEDSTGNKYYIDNNLFKRKYKDETAYNKKPRGCPNTITSITSNELTSDKLKVGAPMGNDFPCSKGCYNVDIDGQTYFVDAAGYKREYEDYLNTLSYPRSKRSISNVYALGLEKRGPKIASGSTYSCLNTSIPTKVEQLEKDNNALISVANQLKTGINQMITKRKDIERKIGLDYKENFTNFKEGWRGSWKKAGSDGEDIAKSKLMYKLEELQKKKQEINKMKGNLNTYNAQIEEQNLNVNSVKMHHLIWMVLGGTFLLTAIINSS